MDSSGSSLSSLGPAEATQLLKDMLNVGKQRNPPASETSSASLASSVRDDIENTSLNNGDSRVHYSTGEVILTPYSGATIALDSDNALYSSGEIPSENTSQGKYQNYASPPRGTGYSSPGGSYGSGHEADRSQSIQGDEGGGGAPGGGGVPERARSGDENGQASLGELLRNMNQQAITKQTIALQGNDRSNSFSVYGRDVDIISSKASALDSITPGSNKVKINPVVNFDWEHKQYVGNLVAVHRMGIHVAYVLRGKSGGIVRIINRKTAERALLRGFSGRVVDISFAHISPIVIGAVDEVGNMFVYEILEGHEGKIDTTLLLSVLRPDTTPPTNYHRLIWCPYIPDDEDPSGTTTNTTADSSGVMEDVGKLLVLTHGETAEMWNVDLVTREYGAGPLAPSDVYVGYLVINSHSKAIIGASFSPDGTALATASLDGEVKFFQVYMHDKAPPRCLHEWKPHDGKPVSSLFFLDDHKHPNPEVQFWKFAVTGAADNTELRVWSCESWVCLQTVRLLAQPDLGVTPCLTAHMDLSANYLILSDIQRKVLYVLQLHQDMANNRAHVASVSEFLLTQPCLSFAVLDAARRRFRRDVDQREDNVDELTTGEVVGDEEQEVGKDAEGSNIGILVKMYSVHTRALQELQIRFRPESSVSSLPPPSTGSVSHDESGLRDQLSDLSMDTVSDLDQAPPPDTTSDISSPRQPQDGPVSSLLSPRRLKDEVTKESPLSLSDVSEKAAEQARAQAEAHLKDLIQGSYASPRAPGGQRPLLMTPEAFSRPGGDSVRSSGSSSFTQVTAMDDDFRGTPHATPLATPLATPHGQPSPGSSVTLTPASSHDLGSPHTSLSIPAATLPLPPTTPGEEAALNLSSPPKQATSSQEFFTSSPASHLPGRFQPPSVSTDTTGSDLLPRRRALQSTGSSSSTSLEVLEILEGARRPEIYAEEPDTPTATPTTNQEPATQDLLGAVDPGYNPAVLTPERVEDSSYDSARGDIYDSDKDAQRDGTYDSSQPADYSQPSYKSSYEKPSDESYDPAAPTEPSYDPAPEGVDEGYDPALQPQTPPMAKSDQQPVSPSKYDERIWPTPPEVDREAQRLASEAIERAATGQQDRTQAAADAEEDEEEEDVLVEEEEEEDQEEDVRIEEEKEEIIEEIDDEDGGGEITIHTHHVKGSKQKSQRPQSIHIPSLQELTSSVRSMVSMLQLQQQEIEQLRSEIRVQRQTTDTVSSLQSHIAQLESGLASRLAGALDQHSQSETERLQQVLGERESLERIRHDQLVSSLTQTLGPSLATHIEHTVREEVKNKVVPAVTKVLDPIKHQLHSEISQKLTATDVLMKENINKLVRSRQSIEAIGSAAGTAMQGPIQAACRDVLLPGFDRACQNMCLQVNQTFQRGTQEYTQQLSSHIDTVRRRHEESRDPVVHQLQALVDAFTTRDKAAQAAQHALATKVTESLEATAATVQNSHAEIDGKIAGSMQGIQDAVLGRLQKLIQDQVVTALQEQQAAISDQLLNTVVATMRSQAPTPVPGPAPTSAPPTPDPQQLQAHVLQLLRQGQLNAAFQQALSASDLKLVMFVCETVDPAKVFSQSPFPLHQPVLLSLIQQLSADLNNNLQLKYRYLEEAVMNLDQNDAVTREHLPAVIGQLCQKLTAFISANPQDRMTRQVRMLLMGAQSLLK